jgi:hypothetical protein
MSPASVPTPSPFSSARYYFGRNHDNTYIAVAPLDGQHQVRQIIRQQIAPSSDLQLRFHADVRPVVKNALRPVYAYKFSPSGPHTKF